jgi:hypothetical protein
MLFDLALHLNHHVIVAAVMVAVVFAGISLSKEKSDERTRA